MLCGLAGWHEDDDEPAHTGDERPACRFLPAARSFAVVSGDNRVGAALDQGGRVECGAHGRPATGDGAAGRAACPGSTFAGVVRRSRARVGARESGQVRSTWRRGGAVEALGSHRGGAVLMPQPAPSASLGFAALGDGGAQTKVSATPSRQHQGLGNARQRRATRIDGGRAGKPLSRPGGKAAMAEGFAPVCLRQLETRRFPRYRPMCGPPGSPPTSARSSLSS